MEPEMEVIPLPKCSALKNSSNTLSLPKMEPEMEEYPSPTNSGHDLPEFLYPSPHKPWFAKNFEKKFTNFPETLHSESMVPSLYAPDSELSIYEFIKSPVSENGAVFDDDAPETSKSKPHSELEDACPSRKRWTPRCARKKPYVCVKERNFVRDQKKSLAQAMKSIHVIHSSDSDSDDMPVGSNISEKKMNGRRGVRQFALHQSK